MKKLYFLILLLCSFYARGQTAASLNIAQSNPLQQVDSENILGIRFDGSAYRIYAFNKWAVLDTVSKFMTRYGMTFYRTKTQNDALYYPLSGNPSGFLTAESDPTVPAYSKSLNSFNVIKSSTDPLYRPISYTPTFTEITGKPTTLSGYGITDGVTQNALSSSLTTKQNTLVSGSNIKTVGGNSLIGSGDISFPTQLVTSVFGRTGTVNALSGDYNTLQVTENTNLYFTQSRARLSLSALANGGITYNSSTGEISQTTPTYNNSPARSLNTSFRPSTTRPTRVSYTISIATTLSLLNLNSSGTVALQISSDNTTWNTINSAGITRTLAVSVSVGLNDTNIVNIQGEIPAGFYCRLVPTTSGGGTVTFTSGQEVTY